MVSCTVDLVEVVGHLLLDLLFVEVPLATLAFAVLFALVALVFAVLFALVVDLASAQSTDG